MSEDPKPEITFRLDLFRLRRGDPEDRTLLRLHGVRDPLAPDEQEAAFYTYDLVLSDWEVLQCRDVLLERRMIADMGAKMLRRMMGVGDE